MSRALRNVPCFVCGLRKPERTSVQAQSGRNGTVSLWMCRECAKDPELGMRMRQLMQKAAEEPR